MNRMGVNQFNGIQPMVKRIEATPIMNMLSPNKSKENVSVYEKGVLMAHTARD